MAREEDVKAVLDRLRTHNEVIRQLIETEEGRYALHEFIWQEGILFGHILEETGETEPESDAQRTTTQVSASDTAPQGSTALDIPQSEQTKQRLWQRAKSWFKRKGPGLAEKLFDKVNDFVKGAVGVGSSK